MVMEDLKFWVPRGLVPPDPRTLRSLRSSRHKRCRRQRQTRHRSSNVPHPTKRQKSGREALTKLTNDSGDVIKRSGARATKTASPTALSSDCSGTILLTSRAAVAKSVTHSSSTAACGAPAPLPPQPCAAAHHLRVAGSQPNRANGFDCRRRQRTGVPCVAPPHPIRRAVRNFGSSSMAGQAGGLSALRGKCGGEEVGCDAVEEAAMPSRGLALLLSEADTTDKCYYSKLTPSQRKAVTMGFDKPLTIIASAGAGKTTTITSRIAYALDTGRVRGAEVLALSFTRKAANEMSERIEQVVGHEAARESLVNTFHQFALHLVRKYNRSGGATSGGPKPSVVADSERYEILHDVLVEWLKTGPRGSEDDRIRTALQYDGGSDAEVFLEEDCLPGGDARDSVLSEGELNGAASRPQPPRQHQSRQCTKGSGGRGSVSAVACGRGDGGSKLSALMQRAQCTTLTSSARLEQASGRRTAIHRGAAGGTHSSRKRRPAKGIRAKALHRAVKLVEALAPLDALEANETGGIGLNAGGESWRQRELKKQPPLLQHLYNRYKATVTGKGSICMCDLVPEAVRTLQKRMKLLRRLRAQYRLVVCDEFQDVTKVQWLLLKLLTAPPEIVGLAQKPSPLIGNQAASETFASETFGVEGASVNGEMPHLTVCGDDDQSIYGWRGAIDAFGHVFDGGRGDSSERVTLDVNFRCSPEIVLALSGVISKNKNRIAKELTSRACAGGSVRIIPCSDQTQEALTIVGLMAKLSAEGVELSQMAILGRTRHVLRELELMLKEGNIDTHYEKRGKEVDYLSNDVVRDVLAFIRLVCRSILIESNDDGCVDAAAALSGELALATGDDAAAAKAEKKRRKQLRRYLGYMADERDDVEALDAAFKRAIRFAKKRGK